MIETPAADSGLAVNEDEKVVRRRETDLLDEAVGGKSHEQLETARRPPPQPQCAIAAAGGKQRAIGAESDTPDWMLMCLQVRDCFTSRHGPDTHTPAVHSSGGQRFLAGQRDAANATAIASQLRGDGDIA